MKTENFDNLSNKDKRIAIAKDVIKSIEAKIYVAKMGHIVETPRSLDNRLYNTIKEFPLQQLIPKYKCKVCAKGALFLSHVLLYNNYNVQGHFGVSNSDVSEEVDYFTEEQMDLIEIAFEGSRWVWHSSSITMNDETYAIQFYEKYPKEDERLVAIMKNIITNKGKFIPSTNLSIGFKD